VVICGPTAAGKTEIALEIARRMPVRLISADSVQVYRGMDIGTAKPDARTLEKFPHALIDIRDPEQAYSAAEFACDAGAEIDSAWVAGALPVVVGGTALYLRALRYGLDAMPSADAALRQRIADEADEAGWPAMHQRLAGLDPESGRRIRASDPQRIQRALEICLASGRPASTFHKGRGPDRLADSLLLVTSPADRGQLHRRIEVRWSKMLELGLIEEVEQLVNRPGLTRSSMALRAVGYRQTIEYLDGAFEREELVDRASAATRQLAKRQLTAFRKWTGGLWYDPLNLRTIDRIISRVSEFGAAKGIAA
jgi:tRNA dimethylallyltransferase